MDELPERTRKVRELANVLGDIERLTPTAAVSLRTGDFHWSNTPLQDRAARYRSILEVRATRLLAELMAEFGSPP